MAALSCGASTNYPSLSTAESSGLTNGPATMETELGRWLIYARDDSIPDAGLDFAFRQYNMTYPAELTDGALFVPAQTFLPLFERAKGETFIFERPRQREVAKGLAV